MGVIEENEFKEGLILREKICNHQASLKKSSDRWKGIISIPHCPCVISLNGSLSYISHSFYSEV